MPGVIHQHTDFNGTDTFTVTITDDDGHAETQDITVTVNAVNDAATFGGNTAGSGNEDGGAITGTLTASDSADGLSNPNFTVSGAASNGSATINATTGAWSYTPDTDFNGTDTFTVTITDDDGNAETQDITVTVNAVNDAATFGGNTAGSGNEDGGAIIGTLTASDSADGLSNPNFTVSGAASNGSATINATTGAWSYTPADNFNGTDTFTVTITDDDGNAETQDITVTVNAVNDAATFGGNTAGSGNEDGGAIIGTLTASDSADGLSNPNFTVSGAASNGSATINATTGAWSYTPAYKFQWNRYIYGNDHR